MLVSLLSVLSVLLIVLVKLPMVKMLNIECLFSSSSAIVFQARDKVMFALHLPKIITELNK